MIVLSPEFYINILLRVKTLQLAFQVYESANSKEDAHYDSQFVQSCPKNNTSLSAKYHINEQQRISVFEKNFPIDLYVTILRQRTTIPNTITSSPVVDI